MVSYAALFEPAEEGGFIVTFPDFGYGVTQGENLSEALETASDLLACLISDVIEAGKPLPVKTPYRGNKFRAVQPPALAAAKAELYLAFLASGIRKSELARRLGIPKTNVDRLFDTKHSSRIEQLEAAFRAIGKTISIEVKDAA